MAITHRAATSLPAALLLVFFSAIEASSPAARLVEASFQETTSPRGASAGDTIVLRFDQPVGDLRLDQLKLVPAATSLGQNATIERSPQDARLAVITLGHGTRLRLYDTYRPGAAPGPERTPTQLGIEGVSVPLLVRPRDRISYVGDRVADSPALSPYYGQLHAHTSLSDGKGKPKDAYAMARANGLDFFGVTEHLEYLNVVPKKWPILKRQAEESDEPGRFVAFYGYEWGGVPDGRSWINHMNVIQPAGIPRAFLLPSLKSFYRELFKRRSDGSVAMFNHPGFKGYRFKGRQVLPTNNWHKFKYRGEVDLRVQLINTDTKKQLETLGYIPALDRGWHLAPEADEDNHRKNWGTSVRRTGVWATGLTRDELLTALRNRATFYTEEQGSWIKLVGDGTWLMGSTLYGDTPHTLSVEIAQPNSATGVAHVELISTGGQLIASGAPGPLPYAASWTVAPQVDAYYYVRATLDSGAVLISAPLFIDK